MKLKKNTKNNLVTYGIVCVLFLLVFLWINFGKSIGIGSMPRAYQAQLVPICVYVVAAIALNLVVGVSGELSLGHAGFMSIGAFSGVVFYQALSFIGQPVVQLVLSMLFGGMVAGFMGMLIGIPVLRLRGDYLAIVTLAFGEIIKQIINCIYLGRSDAGWHFSFIQNKLPEDATKIINGAIGATGHPKVSTYVIGFALILFALTVALNLMRSKHGRAIMAIRDNRIAAESIGLSAFKFKLTAFTVSAILTGMAGSLYSMNIASVQATKFDFNTSIDLLVFVVLGGMGNMRGSIIAAIILTLLPETPLLRGLGEARMLIYAILLIGMMLLTQSKGGKRIVAWAKDKTAVVLKKTKKEGADNE